MSQSIIKPEHELGIGGVPIGTAFGDITDEQAQQILQKAWDLGIRYYDTSPWYGLTKSERRFGAFLKQKEKSEFVFSTKIGRIFTPVEEEKVPKTMWQHPMNFEYKHDYSADATKRSIEDSLERTGLDRINIIFVHDLSEDQVGDRYDQHMEIAKKGAFKVLSDYRDQGIIDAWGMGVNKVKPILDCMESADPDVCLSATQYSIIEHEEATDRLLPEVKKNGVKLVSGAGFNSGFIAGRNRYNYKKYIPKGFKEKREKISQIAENYGTDIIAAAIHFVLAADEFVSIIPGAGEPSEVEHNVKAWKSDIPSGFWQELKEKSLIYKKARVPSQTGVVDKDFI